MDSLGGREPVELVEDGRDVVTDPTVGERTSGRTPDVFHDS